MFQGFLEELDALKMSLADQTDRFQHVTEQLKSRQEAHDDWQLAEQRCNSQKVYIAQLEQRVDELMTAQREAAEQIAVCEIFYAF